MQRRGLAAAVLTVFTWGAMSGVGLAASTAPSPGPSINPPPKCFVMKSNALPTCEQNPDGSWTAVYPGGVVVTIAPNDTGAGTSGGSNTDRNVGFAIMVAALLGVGVIVWRTWLHPDGSGAARMRAGGALDTPTGPPGAVGLNDYYAAPPVVQQPPPVEPPPVVQQPPAAEPPPVTGPIA